MTLCFSLSLSSAQFPGSQERHVIAARYVGPEAEMTVIPTEKAGRPLLLLGVSVALHCAQGRMSVPALVRLELLAPQQCSRPWQGARQRPRCQEHQLPTPSPAAENSSDFRATGNGITKSSPQQQLCYCHLMEWGVEALPAE